MNFLKTINIGNMAKKAIGSILSSSSASYLNYKIGEYGLDGITVADVDVDRGRVVLDMDGETRKVVFLIDELLYSSHEIGIKIHSIRISITMDETNLHKVWLESIINRALEEYIENNDGLWINSHTKKILAVLDYSSYATNAE